MDKNDPTTYQEIIASPNSDKWKNAMKSEIQSNCDNQVWTLIDPRKGLKTIRCKWAFKKKTDMVGNVHTYKAWLIAKGFKQIHGIDYDEVAMLKTIRILLAISAYFDS